MDTVQNEDLKKAFVETKPLSQRKSIHNFLFGNKCRKQEEILKKDLCEFTLDEIIVLLKGLNISNVNSLRVRLSYLRTYTQFCLKTMNESNIDIDNNENQNHYNEVTTEILNNCINENKESTFYFTEDIINNICNTLLNVRDKFLIRSLFEGVGSREITDLTLLTKDSLKDEYKIQIPNGELHEVTPILYELAQECIESEGYIARDIEKDRQFKYKEGSEDYILRPTSGAKSPTVNKTWIIRQFAYYKEREGLPTLGIHMLNESGFYNSFCRLVDKYNSFFVALNSEECNVLKKKHHIRKSNMKLQVGYELYLKYTRDR